MKFERWLRLFFIALVALAVVMIVAPPFALADDDRGRGNDDINLDTDVDVDVTGGDVNVTGGDTNVPVDVSVTGGDSPVSVNHSSKAFALSNGLGDVDIAGCLGSTQWATPIFSKQKLVVNWPCLAEFYLEHGKYELAAVAICNTEIVKEFESEAACEAAHDFTPLADPEPIGEIIEKFGYGQEFQDESIEVIQMAQLSLEERIQALEQKPAPRPRVVQRPAREPEPAFTPEQKAKAWAVLTGEGSEEDE